MTAEIVQRMSKNFVDLSPQLQNAARYIIENTDEVATRSLRQVAKQSGLPAPTYSRLARAVGYNNYEALRDKCREELKQKQLTLAERAALAKVASNPLSSNQRGEFGALHVATVTNNLNRMIANLDPAQLADVADKLAVAKKIKLVGSLSSQSMVDYLNHIANFASANWSVIGQNGISAPVGLADVDDETVLLTISVSPYLRRTLQITEAASNAGAAIIAITDDINSPVLQFAKYSFIVPTDSLQFFPSHVTILTLLEILVGMVVKRMGDKAHSRIDSVEKLGHTIGDYYE